MLGPVRVGRRHRLRVQPRRDRSDGANAQALRGGDLTVDVNEQNPAACRFYEACGFVVEGRSELDSTGRPFPLLQMRLAAAGSARPLADGAALD